VIESVSRDIHADPALNEACSVDLGITSDSAFKQLELEEEDHEIISYPEHFPDPDICVGIQ
jgi:hypothetical protein